MKKLILAGFAISILITSGVALAGAGKAERTAVAATGRATASSVANQAGRSAFFLIFDEKGSFVQALENPYANGQSAGIAVVDFLAGKGVTVLVAESYGPRIVDVMKSKGIRAVEFKGTAEDAAKKAVSAK